MSLSKETAQGKLLGTKMTTTNQFNSEVTFINIFTVEP